MNLVPLGEIAKIDRTTASVAECENLPYVGLEHIEKETGHLVPDFKRQPEKLLATKFKFTDKHVLYGKLRPYLKKVILPSFDGVCTTEILPILPNKDKLDRGYLYTVLLSNEFVKWASAKVSGANLPRLDPKLLNDYRVPLPSLKEQKRIAEILKNADKLRRQRRSARDFSDCLLQSVFVKMFGDPVSNPKGWDIVELSDMGLFVADGNYAEKYPRAEDFVPSGVPFIRANNIKEQTVVMDDMRYITAEKHQFLKKGHLRTNDLLITTRGNIGMVALVPPQFNAANINAQIVLLRIQDNKLEPQYLLWAFENRKVKFALDKLQTGTALKQLPVGNLMNLSLPLPPINLQEKFAGIVQRFERIRSQQREASRQAEHLFETLLHRAFREEL